MKLSNPLTRFAPRNVDTILTSLSKGVTRLEKAIEQNDNKATGYARQANKFDAMRAAAENEAERADRVAKKLRDLLF